MRRHGVTTWRGGELHATETKMDCRLQKAALGPMCPPVRGARDAAMAGRKSAGRRLLLAVRSIESPKSKSSQIGV